MDLIEQIIGDKGAEMIESLTGSLGFDASQAQSFVPAAIRKVMDLIGGGGFDLGTLFSGDLGALTSQVDTAGLAQEAGVDEAQAKSGLDALVPSLTAALEEKAGGAEGVLSMLGGGDSGGLAGAAGALAGKLFK